MPLVPAVCNNCGRVFSSGFELIDCTDISFSGIGVGPCPHCGGNGKILDASYTTFGDSLRILFNRSSKDLDVLLSALKAAQARQATSEEVQAVVEEHAPELTNWLKKILPQNQAQWFAFLSLLIAAITFVKNNLAPNPTPTVINNTVTYAFSELCKPKPSIKFSMKGKEPTAGNRKARLAQRSKARHK
jgi:hypothetical protein